MKKVFTYFATVLFTATLCAQSPEKLSYQAVIRNSDNALVANAQIGMQINILQGLADGTIIYAETHTPVTNANGLVSIEIGTGQTSDNFSDIDWANGPYFIKTGTDPEGGTSYTITGISQLLSVPYALHAKTAETVTGEINESDPVFSSSEAASITASHLSNLNNLSGTNTGDQDLSSLATKSALADSTAKVRNEIPDVSGFITHESDPSLPAEPGNGDMLYWDGIAWNRIIAGFAGQLLTVNASGIPDWQNPSALKAAYTTQPTINATSVVFHGVINTNGFSTSVMFEYGINTDYGNTISATASPVSNSNSETVSSTVLTGLTLGTVYHVRMVVENIFGTFYSNDFQFTNLYNGASYAGGIVFYFNNSGSGLVYATSDQSTGATWEDAINICSNYNDNSYYDWYLPSLDELSMIYESSSLSQNIYWTRTSNDAYWAWAYPFIMGPESIPPSIYSKNDALYVRAVRSF